MIVLGFNTVMSGKTTIDQTESSWAVSNPYKLITERKYRDSIKKGPEVRELVPFLIITTIIKLVTKILIEPKGARGKIEASRAQ
jgi:hypothetical protein